MWGRHRDQQFSDCPKKRQFIKLDSTRQWRRPKRYTRIISDILCSDSGIIFWCGGGRYWCAGLIARSSLLILFSYCCRSYIFPYPKSFVLFCCCRSYMFPYPKSLVLFYWCRFYVFPYPKRLKAFALFCCCRFYVFPYNKILVLFCYCCFYVFHYPKDFVMFSFAPIILVLSLVFQSAIGYRHYITTVG